MYIYIYIYIEHSRPPHFHSCLRLFEREREREREIEIQQDRQRQRQMEEHDVVIVGAGIAGLATAIALKRVGVKALVLEKSEGLRATGAAIGLHSNAWLALEALGVAHKLTTTTYPPMRKYCTFAPFSFHEFLFPFQITIMRFYAIFNFFMKFLDFV